MLSFGEESLVFQFTIQKFKDKDTQLLFLPLVLYGCETWSLTLRKDLRLRVFENRVLRRIFGPKRDGGNYIMRSLMICTTRPILFG